MIVRPLVLGVGLPRPGRLVVLPGTASTACYEAEICIRPLDVVRNETSRNVTAELAGSTGG